MRPAISGKLEQGRIRDGEMASDSSYGTTGAFFIMGPCGTELCIISSDGVGVGGWEHVSVSCRRRIPNWLEMCFVRDLFWTDEECVVQFHPPKADYINCHPHCLHLWRKIGYEFPRPPDWMVGPKP